MKRIALIPSYEPDDKLIKIVKDLINNNFIVVVVNDGSKDSSLEIALEYERKYPKTIRVIDKENGGHGSTINVGLKEATGKFLG